MDAAKIVVIETAPLPGPGSGAGQIGRGERLHRTVRQRLESRAATSAGT
jgi:hypothetical protein